jgi:hypothetical protein
MPVHGRRTVHRACRVDPRCNSSADLVEAGDPLDGASRSTAPASAFPVPQAVIVRFRGWPGPTSVRSAPSRDETPSLRHHEPLLVGVHGRPGAVADLPLGEQPPDVGRHREFRQGQLGGDPGVGATGGDLHQHLTPGR